MELRTVASDPPTLPEARVFERFYDRHLRAYQRARVVARLNTSDLRSLLQATSVVQFFTEDREKAAAMEYDLRMLEARHAALASDVTTVRDALIEAREFDEARNVASAYGNREANIVPFVVHRGRSTGASVLAVSNGGRTLTRLPVDLRRSRVVIVVAPFCHFAQNGLAALRAHADLASVLSKHAVFLVPPPAVFHFREIALWNRAHPRERMVAAYRQSDWPFIDRWELPTFYFVRHGKLVDEVIGWPSNARVSAIRAGLEKAGLLKRPA